MLQRDSLRDLAEAMLEHAPDRDIPPTWVVPMDVPTVDKLVELEALPVLRPAAEALHAHRACIHCGAEGIGAGQDISGAAGDHDPWGARLTVIDTKHER